MLISDHLNWYRGAFRYSDVINAGGSEAKLKLDKLQKEIDFDDAVNIQFTSVSVSNVEP